VRSPFRRSTHDERPRAEHAPAATADAAGEQALVARVRGGDEAAFGDIFQVHYPRLVAFARGSLGARDLAEQIVQDVFVQLWARRESWTIERSLSSYLFRAVRNRVSNERRTLRLETAYAQQIVREIGTAGVTAVRTDDRLSEEELEMALAQALARLPERPRQVFLLNRRENLSYAQIGEELGIALKTVEMHMARALSSLRVALAEWRDQ
jgi:RNA polymerase sigma-70 factor (family 1)